MKQLSFEEFRSIYKNYYKQIIDLFISNHIHFSCACGTMLGAVRENDMIEWDYDIDNFFFLEDIDKIISLEKFLPKNMYIESYKNNKLQYGLVRIYFKNLFRKDIGSNKYKNFYIDFFAIKNVDISENKRYKIFNRSIKEEEKVFFKNSTYKSKTFFRQFIRWFYRLLLPSQTKYSKKMGKRIEKTLPGNTTIMCRNFRLVSRLPIKKDDITYIDFANFKIPCYSCYGEILECLFGKDWWQPKKYNNRKLPTFYVD